MNVDMNTRMSNLVGENEVRHLQILSFRTEKGTNAYITRILVVVEFCTMRQLHTVIVIEFTFHLQLRNFINHFNNRNHHYFSRNSSFIRRSENKPTIKTYQLSRTLRVL